MVVGAKNRQIPNAVLASFVKWDYVMNFYVWIPILF